MAAERQQHEGSVVAAAAEPSVARRLWRVVRAVLYMLRRGLPSGRKLAMDLHLLLHRGRRIAGKALGDRFLASSRHDRSCGGKGKGAAAAGGGHFSCGALDPRVAVHEPSRRRREVEFSCSNTPSSAATGGGGGGALGLLGAAARRRRSRRRSSGGRQQQQYCEEPEAADNGYLMQYYSWYDAAEVARVFEMLSDDEGDDGSVPVPGASTATPPFTSSATTPSPAQAAQLVRLAAGGRQQQQQQARVAPGSSPADGGAQAQVDRRADEFIRRFYEQLRAQRSAASTPDYYGYAASPYGAGAARAPRAVTAGIA